MRKFSYIGALTLLALSCPDFALGQDATAVSNAQSQAEDIARRQREIDLRLRNQELDTLAQPPEGSERSAGPTVTNIPAQGPCFTISKLVVTGVTLLSDAVLDTALDPYRGRCLQISDLDQIIRDITHLYTDRGYITARAFLLEQDLSGGSLDVNVVEGFLEDIVIDGQPGEFKPAIATAFPGMIGRPVNLRDIEQGLDQLNRLNGVNATMEVTAGEQQGGSILLVSRNLSSPFSASLTLDNQGSASTGRDQATLSLSYANPLGLNDQIGLTISRGSLENPFHFSNDVPNTETYAFSYSVPYGRFTFSLNSSKNRYCSEVAGTNTTVQTRGNSLSHSLSAGALLHRDQVSKTSATLAINTTDTENFVAGSLLQSSSFRATNANLSLSHTRRIGQASTSFSLGYGKGLPWFNGLSDDPQAIDTDPKAEFERVTLSASYQRPFRLADLDFSFSSSLNAQWSPDNLYAAQQMSLGGLSTVRGFRDSVISGNVGGYLRNEISASIPVSSDNQLSGIISGFQPFVAVDLGHIKRQARFGIEGGDLIGVSYGIRISGEHVGFELSHGSIWDAPSGVNSADHNYTALSLTARF